MQESFRISGEWSGPLLYLGGNSAPPEVARSPGTMRPWDPAESLAAYYPWLALEWHPSRNTLRPDQVSRASAREIVWRCELGHAWSAVVYQRTLSKSGCPDCYRLEAGERSKAGKRRAQEARTKAA